MKSKQTTIFKRIGRGGLSLTVISLTILSLLVTFSIAGARDRGDGFGRGNDCSGSGGRSRSLSIIGLTNDQRLICFNEFDPDDATTIDFVAGLSGGDTALIGIDFRPANGDLYGVGNAGGIYTIDPSTAAATFQAQLSVALQGASFGVDVNPAADALRVISDTGQNLRFSFASGTTTTDGTLSYPPTPPPATGLTGAAYTNNDSDSNTATTLYDIDSTLDQVAIQAPANAGTLSATGKLGVDTLSVVGFDIYSTIRNGTTVGVQGFASLSVDGRVRFYRVALFTGRATLRGNFRLRNQVIDIAIPLNQL